MGSKFLGTSTNDLSALEDGSFALNVATADIQSLVPSMPVRASATRELVSGLIEVADCNFTPLTNPATGDLDMNNNNITNTRQLALVQNGDVSTPPVNTINIYNNSGPKYIDSSSNVYTFATTDNLTAYLPLAGGTMTGPINMGGQEVTNSSAFRVSGTNIIIGDSKTNATNTDSTAIGTNCSSTGDRSIAIGNSSNSSTQFGVAIGANSLVNGSAGIAIGSYSTSSAGIVIGSSSTSNAFRAHCFGSSLTNNTANSVLIGAAGNIRASDTTCDLGTIANPFQTLYLNANIAGPTNSRTADNIVSNAGASTSGNLTSFSGTTGKVVTDSGIVATNVVTNSGGVVTAGQVATFSGTTGKLITNSTTPILGTPASGTLSNCTGLPISTGVSGLGTNVATMLGSFTSSNIKAACTNPNGTGGFLVFSTEPDFTGATQRLQPLKLSKMTQYDVRSITNTTTPTSFLTASSVGSSLYAANTTNDGMVIKIRAFAQLNNWAGGGTLTISLYINGAVTMNLLLPAGTAATSHFLIEFDCTVKPADSIRGQGVLMASGQLPVLGDTGGRTWTKSALNSVDVVATWSVASASNQMNSLSLTIETHYQT